MTSHSTPSNGVETFPLGPFILPRIWNGLWQLSSNAWGTAPASTVRAAMRMHVESGLTAFDMADHYGSAEILFGQFRNSYNGPNTVVAATKWCVFRRIDPTRETVEAAVQERITRMQADHVDLLQLHWHEYSNLGYITAFQHLRDLQAEGKIISLGLCNFDAHHTDSICTELGPGAIVSNQVQFSVIDTRPLHGMSDVCLKHNVKLLTYGTLCGGFLADKWLGADEPDPYDASMNPSQRKYLEVIVRAWGDWSLFQELLALLRKIGDAHGGRSIANIATRWVLDHPFVGAVLVGSRLGVTEHTTDNLQAFGFRLSSTENTEIEAILSRSQARSMISTMGDCGGEYR